MKTQLRYFLTLGCIIVLSSVGSLVSNKQWDDAVAFFFVRRSLNADSCLYSRFYLMKFTAVLYLRKLYLSKIRLKAGHTPLHPISLAKYTKNKPTDVDNTKNETWFSSRLCLQRSWCKGCTRKWKWKWKWFTVQDCNNPSLGNTQSRTQGACVFFSTGDVNGTRQAT